MKAEFESFRNVSSLHIYLSYAHQDKGLVEQFLKHLYPLQIQYGFDVWYDEKIRPGDNWNEEIMKNLEKSDVFIIFLSPDFLNSEFITKQEGVRILEKIQRQEARLIPILLKDCYYSSTPWGQFQIIPKDGRPVTDHKSTDEAFHKIVVEIEQLPGFRQPVSVPLPLTNVEDFQEVEGSGLESFRGISSNSNAQTEPTSESAFVNSIADSPIVPPVVKENLLIRDNIYIIDRTVEPALDATAISKVLAGLIISLKPQDPAKVIGIFGRWGRGKSFLFEQIWKILEKENRFIRVDFHAWRYQDTPASWAYLYETFADKYFDEPENPWHWRHWGQYIRSIYRRLKLNFRREGVQPLSVFFGLFLVAFALYIIGELEWIKNGLNMVGSWSIFGISALAIGTFLLQYFSKNKTKAIDLFKAYSGKLSFEKQLGMQAEIQKELKILLRTWLPRRKDEDQEKRKQILLFVDDIDRCNEKSLLQVIDAIRVMLEERSIYERVTVVLAVDEELLRYAIINKYKDFVKDPKPQEIKALSEEYLDKVFLTGIKLANLTPGERGEILDVYTKSRKVVSITMVNPVSPETGPPIAPPVTQEASPQQAPAGSVEQKTQQASATAPAAVPTEIFEITDSEYDKLKTAVEKQDLTPRQIRIFYYRYLLAKALLKVLRENDKAFSDAWEENMIVHHLPFLIAMKTGGDDIYQKYVFPNKINENIKNQLLFVTEMVVAYEHTPRTAALSKEPVVPPPAPAK